MLFGCVSLIVVAVWCAPAWGLVSRGHMPAGGFEGSGGDALAGADGVAVAEASGVVFVADRAPGAERVEEFAPDGAGGYEFVGSFKVKSPAAIAVDNSTGESDPSRGDVYVVGGEAEGAGVAEDDVLYKYDPATGKVLSRRQLFHAKGEELELSEVYGVAVDTAGTVWVYEGEEGTVSGFTDAVSNQWEPGLTRELLVAERYGCQARPGFAVAGDDAAFYALHERQTGLEECPGEETTAALAGKFGPAGEPLARAVDHEPTTGIAVDPVSGDVYADNGGSIAAFSPGGALIQRFGGGNLAGGGAVAVNAKTDVVYALEPAQGRVVVFGPEEVAAPTVDGVVAQSLGATSERLTVQIDPHGAPTSYYLQYGTVSCTEDASGCMDAPLPPPGVGIGSGFGDQTESVELQGLSPNTTYFYRVIASNSRGTVQGPQTTETFFTTLPSAQGLLADDRQWQLVSPAEKHGAAIEAISREGALIQSAADGEAITWAASSPVTGEGAGNRRPEPVQVLSDRTPGEGWSSTDIATPHDKGEGYLTGAETEYRAFAPNLSASLVEPQVQSEPLESPPLAAGVVEKTIYLRGASGEFEPLVTRADDQTGEAFGGKLEYRGASADLQHVVFESQVPLLSGAVGGGLYEWEAGAPLKLISVLPGGAAAGEPTLGDADLDVRGAVSADGSRVFWTEGASDEGPLFMHDTTTGETVQINAVQGEGTHEPTEAERLEGLDQVHFQSATPDGSRVFFTDTWPLTSESALEALAEEAIVEGSSARNAGRPADLYEYSVETGVLTDLTVDDQIAEPADVLGTIPGIGENGSNVYFVANGMLAPGAQPGDCPRTEPKLPHPQAGCNLYVSEPEPGNPAKRTVRLIARLSYEDSADWGQRLPTGGLFGVMSDLTSAVSGNGRYLAFMSQAELTGYDNVDSNPAADGAHDQEVYLYDAQNGRLDCVSCNPDGQAPQGVFDTEEAGEGTGLLVDRPETWKGEWLAGSIPGWTAIGLTEAQHQARYLSNSGRLFFDSADALLPQVTTTTRQETVNGTPQTVGVENAYEYEPQRVGSCTQSAGCLSLLSSGTSAHESAFLDASENGDDAFFTTAAQLVPNDTDDAYDVYDAAVCGTAETQPCLPTTPPPPPQCAGEECRPPAPETQPNATPPLSASYSGPGNAGPNRQVLSTKSAKPATPTHAQKLKAALKACRKLHNEHKRARCDARARKAYASTAKPRTKSAKAKRGARR